MILQEFTPHPGGETEALRRLEESLADEVRICLVIEIPNLFIFIMIAFVI